MPGIVGIIGKGSHEENKAALNLMVKSLMHEPFYTCGTFINEDMGLYVGWVSIAGSFADCMPLWNEDNTICLIFTGEDFTDQSKIDYLRAHGHNFVSKNASYLVHLFEELGSRFFEGLNGWFSGLLIDFRERKIVLFNDRYGLNRIYQHEALNGFYFASEAKALLQVLPELRHLNMSSFGESISCGCPLQNKTLFSGISLLPGGSAWKFSLAQNVVKEQYFRPEVWENQELLSETEYYEKLKDTWARILPRYFQGKEQVAVSLTGGKDSRMIMAWSQSAPGSLPCYTFGGMFRDCEDVKLARLVANICQQPHHVIPVGREFLTQFPALAEKSVYISDGAMDVSGTPDLYVNRIARQIAPVRLTGNYGQEILRRAVAFRPRVPYEGLFDREFYGFVRNAAQTYFSELNENRLSFVAFKQVPWHHYSRLSLELSQLTLRSPFLDNDLVALSYQVPPSLAESIDPQLRLIAEGNQNVSIIGTDRGLLYQSVPIFTKLKHLYQEFTFKAEYAYDYGMPQWLAISDNMLRQLHIEKLFLGRHKFYHFRLWYRDDLSRYIKDVLLDPRTLARPYLNGRCLEQIVTSHIKGYRNYTSEIHRMLTSELLQRTIIEQD